MSDFLAFFTRFLPDLMQGAGITLLLTAEGLTAGFVLGTALGLRTGLWQQILARSGGQLHRVIPRHTAVDAIIYHLLWSAWTRGDAFTRVVSVSGPWI